MKDELEKQLKEKHPIVLRRMNVPGREPISMFGIECGDGWYDLIDETCSWIEEIIKKLPQEEIEEMRQYWGEGGELPSIEDILPAAVQIKEKFGGLRFYMSWQTEAMDEIIRQAEGVAERTCMACGKEGKMRGDGWLTVQCDACEKEAQAKREAYLNKRN